mgnify:CR=1 FL=1
MDAAAGRIPCDLSIVNVRLVNMLTGEIYPAEVDILDGAVARVRQEGTPATLPARQRYDGGGRYLMPGLIDTHMHVESTMLIPQWAARAILPWGTTTVCTDPHEIANVAGRQGVAFMLDNTRRAGLRQYILAPSCVPAVPGLESAGASFSAQDVAELLDMPGVLWPKFDDKITGENLALTGAIRDAILDTESLAVILCNRLRNLYPELLYARYKLNECTELDSLSDFELFELIGRRRGFIVSGGEVSLERTAVMLLDEFRGAKIGRISLERPRF